MDIATGLASLKTGFDIARTVNQRIKEGKLSAKDIADQLLQLQQLLLDSQGALNDAAEEIRILKQQIGAQDKLDSIEKDLEWVADGGFWVRKSENDASVQIAYCPLCWGQNKQLVPLNPTEGKGYFTCKIHKSGYETKAHRDYIRELQNVSRRRINNYTY